MTIFLPYHITREGSGTEEETLGRDVRKKESDIGGMVRESRSGRGRGDRENECGPGRHFCSGRQASYHAFGQFAATLAPAMIGRATYLWAGKSRLEHMLLILSSAASLRQLVLAILYYKNIGIKGV